MKLTHLENPFLCKILIMMVMHKIIEYLLYIIKPENISFPVIFLCVSSANYF